MNRAPFGKLKTLGTAGPRVRFGSMPFPADDSAERMYAGQCAALNLEAVPQYRFAADDGRAWRADFAFLAARVLVEIDGGIWTRGAHGRPTDIVRNMRKQNHAARMGWRTLRFSPEDVRSGLALEETCAALRWRFK